MPTTVLEEEPPAARELLLVVACALIDEDGRVLLAQRPQGRHLAGYWEFPGGKLAPGETPESCLVRELRAADAGSTATLAGWVHRRRDHGGLTFIDLRDSTGIVQVVVNPTLAPAAHEAAQALRSEFVVRIMGEIVELRAPVFRAPDGRLLGIVLDSVERR